MLNVQIGADVVANRRYRRCESPSRSFVYT